MQIIFCENNKNLFDFGEALLSVENVDKFCTAPLASPYGGRWQPEGLTERALSVSFADSSPRGRAKWRCKRQ